MLEEAPCIAGTHRLESSAQGFQQGFSGARPGLTHKSLELGEGLFYWVEVRRVGWQVEKLAASSFDELPDPRALVGGEVVHHHDLSRLQRGSQNPLHVGLKDNLRGRPSTARDGPIPARVMLESSVTLAPQLRGASKHTLWP